MEYQKGKDSSLKDFLKKIRDVFCALRGEEMRLGRIVRRVLELRVKPKEDKS